MGEDFNDAESEGGEKRLDVAATLSTVVEMVRRVMRVDTAGVATFSLDDRTVTWKAMSGFRSVAAEGEQEIVNPLRGEFAERAASVGGDSIIEVRGLAGDLPASEFPLHSAEGVRDLALVQLVARGETLGVLAVGFRASHRFTAEEKVLLEGLAGMAALALDNARLFETIVTGKKIWEQTFDAIPDGIIVHDDAMRIARCNLAAAEMMGLGGPSEAIGMACAEAFARLFGERAAAYHMKQGTGARVASAFELQAEDGRRYLVTVSPLTSLESGVAGLKTERDATADSLLVSPDSRLQTLWSVITWSDITEPFHFCSFSGLTGSPRSGNSPPGWRTKSTTRSPPSPPAPRPSCATCAARRRRRRWPPGATGISTSKRSSAKPCAARPSRAAS